MEEFTKELLEQLNVKTVFTIGPFAISESVVVSWIVMAVLIIGSIWLTRGLKYINLGRNSWLPKRLFLGWITLPSRC